MLNNGEGTINLAWAFNKAGIKSAVISLWDVNDYASWQIMTSFYKNLKSGMIKPEALRQAKLDYLKNNDEVMSNPYYWAGFEYYGPNTGFAPQQNTGFIENWMLILAGLLVLTGFGFVFLKSRRMKVNDRFFIKT